MDNAAIIIAQCKSFRRTLDRARYSDRPLDKDFVRRFNDFMYTDVLARTHGQGVLKALFLYLFQAIRHEYRLETFQALILQTPRVLAETDGSGFSLLHAVRFDDDSKNACDVVSFVVEHFPGAAKTRDLWRNSPLHFARRRKAPLPAIRALVEADPSAARGCNDHGNTPLHDASDCPWFALDAIRYLVLQEPSACVRRNKYGNLPLDRANKFGSRYGDVEFMAAATAAAAKLMLKHVCFNGLPQDIFELIMGPFLGHDAVSIVKAGVSPSPSEIAVLFRRNDIREDFRAQIQVE